MNQCLNRRVDFLTQVNSARIVAKHEKPCDTGMQAQSQNRLENRRKKFLNSDFAKTQAAQGSNRIPKS